MVRFDTENYSYTVMQYSDKEMQIDMYVKNAYNDPARGYVGAYLLPCKKNSEYLFKKNKKSLSIMDGDIPKALEWFEKNPCYMRAILRDFLETNRGILKRI